MSDWSSSSDITLVDEDDISAKDHIFLTDVPEPLDVVAFGACDWLSRDGAEKTRGLCPFNALNSWIEDADGDGVGVEVIAADVFAADACVNAALWIKGRMGPPRPWGERANAVGTAWLGGVNSRTAAGLGGSIGDSVGVRVGEANGDAGGDRLRPEPEPEPSLWEE